MKVGCSGKKNLASYALDTGVSKSGLAIKAVEKKARKKRLGNITTILSDRDTQLPEESVDVILLYDTLHMIKDKQALLKELHRVMKANGVLSSGFEHMKANDVLQVVQQDGIFSLRAQKTQGLEKGKYFGHGKLLNFERRD